MKLLLKKKNVKVCALKLVVKSITFLLCLQVNAQDFHFTQFYANKLFLSPSFAGATAQNRFIGNYRNQWPGVKGFITYSLSYDHFFSNYNSGIGVMAMRDISGDGNLGTMNLGLYYSYVFPLTELIYLRPGISLSYLQRSIDFSKLTFSDQLTGSGVSPAPREELAGKDKVGTADAAASMMIYSKNWWIGTTFDHLMRPNLSFIGNEDRVPLKYSVFGGITMFRQGRLLKPIDETISLAFLLTGMDKSLQTDIGLYWAQIPLTFGVWYRGIPVLNSERGDAFAILVGIKTKGHFGFGYSYDFTISNLMNSNTSGSHEVALSYEFAKKRKKKLHTVPCPEF